MIEVKTEKMDESNFQNTQDVTAAIYNKAAEGLAEILLEKLKDVNCADHPNQTSILWIRPSKQAVLVVDKSEFCCKKFDDQVPIEYK